MKRKEGNVVFHEKDIKHLSDRFNHLSVKFIHTVYGIVADYSTQVSPVLQTQDHKEW